MNKIKGIYGDEPRRENEYGWAFVIGHDGVTMIIDRHENHGDHSVGWFDVFKGGQLIASMGHRHVAVVTYEDQPND